MKVKYLLLSLLACAGFAVTSCTEEDPIFGGDELALKVEPSIISVGKDGGSRTIDINAGIEWKAEPKDSWITVSPSSGNGAGKVTVTVAKNDTEDARQTTVAVTAGTAKMNITVKQEAGGVVYGTAEHPYTPSRVYAYLSTLSDGEKTDDIYIEGFIAKIDEQFGTQYGNATFYMTDDGKTEAKMFQVYRALYIGNKKYDNEADKNINVGDKVVVYGKCVNYKGNTPETSSGEAYVVSIEEGTMPVLEMAEKSKAISAGDTTAEFDLSVKNLTAKWTVTPKEAYAWVKDYTKEGTASGKITITVEANTADDAREAKFTVASDGAQSLEFTLTQNGNVLPANIGELIAAIPATATGSSTKAPFEANLKEAAVVTYVNGGTAYIEDATGAVILYNTNHGLKAGDTVKGKISGDCYWYNGAPEILGLGEAYEKGEGTAPAPKEITIPELLANYPANLIRFVVIKGVTVTDAIEDGDRNGKVAVGSDEIAVYAQLKEQGLTLNKDAEGNLTAIVGCYNDNKQLLFWDNAWFEKTGGPVEVPAVYLNEFDPNNKKIEIYNSTDAEVDMTGWTLTKDNDESTKFVIAAADARAKIAAKGFVVFTCKSDGINDPSFGLSPTKGFIITMKDKDGNVVDNVDNSAAREGGIVTMGETQSWGRETDGADKFVLFDTPTIGAANGSSNPPAELGEYDTNVKDGISASSDNASYTDGVATVNGTADVFTLKFGTSKKFGSATVTLPAGTKSVSFYGVGWKDTPASLKITLGGNVIPVDLKANDGATGNSPYTITVTEADKYSFNLGGALPSATPVTVETYEGNNTGKRAILFGIQASENEVQAAPKGITIDGNFSDWAAVTTGVASEAETPVYMEFKATSDGTNLYFYSKRDNRAAIWNNGGYFYYDVDADNNSETGETKDGVPGLESWFYIKPFAGTSDAPAIATAFNGSAMSGTVTSNVTFAGLNSASYVEVEVSIPIGDMKVTKGSTIKVYSWSNKDGYDVQSKPITITVE